MKTILLAVILAVVSLLNADICFSQGDNGGVDTITMTGKISPDGKKFKTEDNQEWAITNPSMVSGHEGDKVTITGKIHSGSKGANSGEPGSNGGSTEAENEIQVTSVKAGNKSGQPKSESK